jgi:hypothetical protein
VLVRLDHVARVIVNANHSPCDRGVKLPGLPETRIEIDLANVGATVDEFQAIGEDPARFAAFVNARL